MLYVLSHCVATLGPSVVSEGCATGVRWVPPAFVGFALGTLLTVLVTMAMVRRYVVRVRAADARARRAKRLAELGSMTRGLAHEIKNPLSTIGLNVQLLTEAIEDLPLQKEERTPLLRRLGSLGRETERLRGILTDFLEYAGELRLDRRDADLNIVIDELIDFFIPQALQQDVQIRSDLFEGPLHAFIDPSHIKQAVINLMLNAVQAMSQQPKDIARELILRTVRGTDEERNPVVVLHVIDTGPGIPSEAAERIFDPYFTTKSGGSGLGLPTARRIVEAHGGKIELHTEEGRGTDFVITLPVEAGEAVPDAPKASGEGPRARGLRTSSFLSDGSVVRASRPCVQGLVWAPGGQDAHPTGIWRAVRRCLATIRKVTGIGERDKGERGRP